MKLNKQDLINMITEEVNEIMGIGEPTSRDIMIGNISDMFKEMHGWRPRHYNWAKMTDQDLEELEKEISAEYDDWHNEERVQADLDSLYDDDRNTEVHGDIPTADNEYDEYDQIPQQLGMSRGSPKKMKFRLSELKAIVEEEIIETMVEQELQEIFGMLKSKAKPKEEKPIELPDGLFEPSGRTFRLQGQEDDAKTAVEMSETSERLKDKVVFKVLGSGLKEYEEGKVYALSRDNFEQKFVERKTEDGVAVNVYNLDPNLPPPAAMLRVNENLDADEEQLANLIMADPEKVEALKKALQAEDYATYSDLIAGYSATLGTPDTAAVEDYLEPKLSEGLQHHIDTTTPLTKNIYRIGSDEYFNVIREARVEYKKGTYKPLNEEEEEMLNSDLGEWVMFEGESVPLDFPMYEETLEEAKKKKKKKDPPIGKPTKNTGGGKKYKVFVRNPKTGKIKKITYGDSKGGLKGNWNSAEARASFASRHNCAEKKDRTKAGYWACRAHKDFGTNVPGRFW